jgi:hypothetical protein
LARYGSALRGIFVWLLLAVAAPASAQGQPNFDRYFEAADRFDRLASEALRRGGPPPRLSDPRVAALFSDLTQMGRVFDPPAFTLEDMPRVTELMQRSLAILSLYMDWGPPPPEGDAARAQAANRNMVLYQAEVVPMLVFIADMSSALLSLMTAFVSDPASEPLTDGQRDGVATSRQGINEVVAGLLGMISYPGVTPENQLVVANALAANGPRFAAALTLSQRRALAEGIRIKRDRATGAQTRAALTRALEAFSAGGCEGLCAI